MPKDLMRETGEAIENAARTLPPGWRIELHIEREGGAVELFDEGGESVDFPTNYDSFGEQINDAVRFAIEEANNARP